MNIKYIVLERVVKWLIGGELFDFVREMVEIVNDSNMTGEQKRKIVQKRTMQMFGSTLEVFINLAIEVAVIILKESLKNEKSS